MSTAAVCALWLLLLLCASVCLHLIACRLPLLMLLRCCAFWSLVSFAATSARNDSRLPLPRMR